MRLDRTGGEEAAARLLSQAYEIGVRSFHCSAEYPTFALFAAAWRRAGLAAKEATLVAKLASPHFGEARFSSAQVRGKLDDYRRALGVERIDTVQWLLRYDLKDEAGRRRILAEADGEIAGLVAALKHEGRIAAFVGFPYTGAIAEALVPADWCDGLAVYVNPLERELDAAVNTCGAAGKPVLAIRPFAAGRVFAETDMTAEEALGHAFAKPAVASVVVSASSTDHLDVLRRWSA